MSAVIEYQDGRPSRQTSDKAEAIRILTAAGMHQGATYESGGATVTEYWDSPEAAQMEQGCPSPAAIIED